MPVRMVETGPAEVYVIHLLWRLPSRVNLAETIPLRFMPCSLPAIRTRFVQSLHKMACEESGWNQPMRTPETGRIGKAHGALTARLCSCLTNQPDKAPRLATYTVTHSTGVSETTLPYAVIRSSHSRPAPFRFDFKTARSVLRHLHNTNSRRSAERDLERLSGIGKPVILVRHHPLTTK
jgi:hypothetical protein